MWILTPVMTLHGSGRYVAYERSRRLIYVSAKVADDSAFPFSPGDELSVQIDAKNGRLVIEKV